MDLLLRNTVLVDGTGDPARPAEVLVADDRIVAVGAPGELTAPAGAEVADLGGLTLAPGFIDIHTHYDAQILWDGDLTPSSWHGVTSVVMGNCGFGVAPTRPEHRSVVVGTLENVEGMSAEALNTGMDWTFESFPEYLAAIDARRKRINVGAFVGHSPVRLYVLGGDEREATPAEIDAMRAIVRESMEAGALGFSTSKARFHQGDRGRPVPSRFASTDEIYALTGVLADLGRGVVQLAIGDGLFVDEIQHIAATGLPITFTALLARSERPGSALRTMERATASGDEIYPQIACRPIVMQVTLVDPTPLAEVDEWKEALALPREERAGLYRDPSWRDRARQPTLDAWAHRWERISVEETTHHGDLVGVPLTDVAAARGTTPFDVLLDIALADDLGTRFRIVMDNDGEAEIAELLADRRTILGLSDAGAHASQLCDACFSTYLLGHWVRDLRAITLEEAVWRLSGQIHHAFRLTDRGLVQPGFHADLVAFDPDRVGILPIERRHDFPGGADRLVVESTGIEHMWVNGVQTRANGQELAGVAPGRLLR